MMGRNPNWKEEELILALELYVSKGLKWLGRISDTTEEVVALSKILNSLDLYDVPKNSNFRSVGSVRMKLGNFKMFDPQYSGGTLANAGKLDKEIWNKYANDIQLLYSKCLEIIREHFKGQYTLEIKKYISRIEQSAASEKPHVTSQSDWEVKMVRILLDEAVSKENKQLADKYSEILSILGKPSASEQNIYHEHGGINQALVGNSVEDKIGKHVRDEMRKLIADDMIWDSDIQDFLSEEWSKDVLHLSHAFFVRIDINKNIKMQLRDSNDYLRYWKDIYSVHDQHYAICKEWFESGRKYFDKWLERFIKEKKLDVSSELFIKMLLVVKELDQKAVCISVPELKSKMEDETDTEKFVGFLNRWNVLSSFQGSTRDYNIDDYDRFFDMINNPQKYVC